MITLTQLFFSFLSLWAASEAPSHEKFLTLESANFQVIVNAEQQDLGRYYLRKLEQANEFHRAQFKVRAPKIPVLLLDRTDSTNGYATRIPYPHVVLYPALPSPYEGLAEYGDWALEFTTHELTHIMTFESVTGFAKALENIFGTIVSPNILLPTWWKEGVAVHLESRVRGYGRLNSIYQDSYLRALAKDGQIQKHEIAEINEALPDWPFGARPYLFGSVLWSEIVAQKGPELVNDLHEEHGGQIPYLINNIAERKLGLDYESFYRESLSAIEKKALAQLNRLQQLEITSFTDKQLPSKNQLRLRRHPQTGTLAVLILNRLNERQVVFYDRQGQLIKDAEVAGDVGTFQWHPTKEVLIYDKIHKVSRYKSVSDLWQYELKTNQSTQLTKSLRARDAVFSFDGESLYFVRLNGARTLLSRYDLNEKNWTDLVTVGFGERISSPLALSSKTVGFTLRKEGRDLLQIYSEEDKGIQTLSGVEGRFLSAQGEEIYLLTSANGTWNVAKKNHHEISTLTHTPTAILDATPSPQPELLETITMTSQGPRYGVIQVRPQPLASLPPIKSLLSDRYEQFKNFSEELTDLPIVQSDYRASSYLWPRYWFPLISFSSINNALIFQASTSGFDPLKKHIYSATLAWDGGVNEGTYQVQYENNVTALSTQVSTSRTISSLASEDQKLIQNQNLIVIKPDLFFLSENLDSAIGWLDLKTKSQTTEAHRAGPTLSLLWSDLSRRGEQISPEDGMAFYLNHTAFTVLKNTIPYHQTLASATTYTSFLLPEGHALFGKISLSYVPQKISALYGVQTNAINLVSDTPLPHFLLRGYKQGQLLGKSLGVWNFEYRFPLRELRKGFGTKPFYVTRLHGAFFIDAAQVEGSVYEPKIQIYQSTEKWKVFSSYGFEARLETTLGYFLPINWTLALAKASEEDVTEPVSLNLGLQIGTLF